MSDEHDKPRVDEDSNDKSRAAAALWDRFKNSISGLLNDIMLGHERGTAIVHHAGIEEAMRRAISARFFASGDKATHLIGGDETPGVLGFSDQCHLAYCLGIIGDETFSDLKKITRVRNRFAHGGKGLTFEDQRINDLCKSLTLCERLNEEKDWRNLLHERNLYVTSSDPRTRYVATAILIQACLEIESAEPTPSPLEGPSRLV